MTFFLGSLRNYNVSPLVFPIINADICPLIARAYPGKTA